MMYVQWWALAYSGDYRGSEYDAPEYNGCFVTY